MKPDSTTVFSVTTGTGRHNAERFHHRMIHYDRTHADQNIVL